MRNKFFELIEKGVAPASYKDVVSDHPEVLDDAVREYNNIFSLVSDTHMDIVSDPKIQELYPEHTWKYIITGSLIGYGEQRWEKFCCDPSTYAGAFNPKPAGYFSVADFFSKTGLAGVKRIVNGDVVYLLYSITDEEKVEPEESPLGVVNTSGVEAYVRAYPALPSGYGYVTTESQIPHHISELSVNVNKKDVQECFKGKKNLYEVAEAMNTNENVLGENWIVFEGHIVGYVGNKTIIIK